MSDKDTGYRIFKTAVRFLPSIGLLVLYFSGLSFLGVSLSVPFAFLWLMWTLNGIKQNQQRIQDLEKKIEQLEAR